MVCEKSMPMRFCMRHGSGSSCTPDDSFSVRWIRSRDSSCSDATCDDTHPTCT